MTSSSRLTAFIQFVTPPLVVIALWEAAVRFDLVSSDTIPAPTEIGDRLLTLARDGVLLEHVAASAWRLVVGYLLSVVIGIAVGAVLASSRPLRNAFSPILTLLLTVPTIAWVPVLLIVLGLGDATIITAVFLGGFFAIAFNTMRGVEMVDKSQVRAARTLGVSGLGLFPRVYLPASMVATITGLRLGIGYAWRALVGGEMLSALAEWGVGKLIYQARFFNDLTAMFVGLLIIGLGSLFVDRVVLKRLEVATIEKWGMVEVR